MQYLSGDLNLKPILYNSTNSDRSARPCLIGSIEMYVKLLSPFHPRLLSTLPDIGGTHHTIVAGHHLRRLRQHTDWSAPSQHQADIKDDNVVSGKRHRIRRRLHRQTCHNRTIEKSIGSKFQIARHTISSGSDFSKSVNRSGNSGTVRQRRSVPTWYKQRN